MLFTLKLTETILDCATRFKFNFIFKATIVFSHVKFGLDLVNLFFTRTHI